MSLAFLMFEERNMYLPVLTKRLNYLLEKLSSIAGADSEIY